MNSKVERRKSLRRFAWLIGVGSLLYILYTAVRARILVGNTHALFRVAERFSRDYWVGDPKNCLLTLVVMGDSTALGQGASGVETTIAHQLAQAMARKGLYVHVVNLAASGSLLSQVLSRQAPQLARLNPDLAILCIGANDTTHCTDLRAYRRDLASLLSQVDATGATLLIASTPDMYQSPAVPWPLAWATGWRARLQDDVVGPELAGHRAQYVDLYNDGKLVSRDDPALYASDLFHPSDKGYALWAQLFIAAANRARRQS